MACSTITVALGAILIVYFVYVWRKYRVNHYWKMKNVPSETPYPFLGNILSLIREKRAFFEQDADWYRKYGRIFGAYFGNEPMIFVAEPDLLRQILVKDFHMLTDRRTFVATNDVVVNFISVLEGDTWKRVRSVMTPAFSTGKLKKMVKLMVECADTTNNNFSKAAELGQPVDCKKLFGGYTLDVIASAAFGTKLNSAEDPDNIFIQHAKKVFNVDISWTILLLVLFPRISSFFFKLKPRGADVMSFFKDLTMTIVERRRNTNEVRNDFLNCLMEAQGNRSQNGKQPLVSEEDRDLEHQTVDQEELDEGGMEDENLMFFKEYGKNKSISNMEFIAQCILFFLAGYETTATALAMTVYYLAQNLECQEKVIREVDRIWRKHDSIDMTVLNEMKYTDAVISETLRMAPPGTRLERKAVVDYPLGNTGITITKGMIIGVPVFAMHHDPAFFPDPEKFDPDRFLPENRDLIQPYTYLPFGAGPRNCLGLRFALAEIKLCLLKVFRFYTFHVCPETKIPMHLLRGAGLYQPKDVMLKVKRREK